MGLLSCWVWLWEEVKKRCGLSRGAFTRLKLGSTADDIYQQLAFLSDIETRN
jgi:hypothetical protein